MVNIKKITWLQIRKKLNQNILTYDHKDSNFSFSPNINPSTLNLCLSGFM